MCRTSRSVARSVRLTRAMMWSFPSSCERIQIEPIPDFCPSIRAVPTAGSISLGGQRTQCLPRRNAPGAAPILSIPVIASRSRCSHDRPSAVLRLPRERTAWRVRVLRLSSAGTNEKIVPSMQKIINTILEAMIEAQTEYYKWSGGWWSPENFITVSVYNKIRKKISPFVDEFYLTLENNIRHGIQQAGGFKNPGRRRNDIGGRLARFDIVLWNGDVPLPIEIKTHSDIRKDLEEICAVLTDTQINNGIVAFLTGARNCNTLRNKKSVYARQLCEVNRLQSTHHTKIKWVGENDYTYPYWGAVVLHISNHRTIAA